MELGCVVTNFLVRHSCINLHCLDTSMSKHFTYEMTKIERMPIMIKYDSTGIS